MSTLSSKPYNYWALKLAIAQASDDPREAPWYGPWNIVLQDLFKGFCPTGYCTATYPQFPLVKDIDLNDSEEEESDKEMDRRVKHFRRSAAPSPEVPRGYRLDLPRTPPKKSSPSPKKLKQNHRSVRIPDFVQLVFKIDVNGPDNIVNDPPEYDTGLLLLVEIKRAKPFCQIVDFFKVMEQTDQQARHAFAYYPWVVAFGLIIAFGDRWLYREYHRKDLRPSPTLSEHMDPTFMDSDTINPRMATTYADVEKFFVTSGGFAHLQSRTSDDALVAVRKRLGYLSSLMFRT